MGAIAHACTHAPRSDGRGVGLRLGVEGEQPRIGVRQRLVVRVEARGVGEFGLARFGAGALDLGGELPGGSRAPFDGCDMGVCGTLGYSVVIKGATWCSCGAGRHCGCSCIGVCVGRTASMLQRIHTHYIYR